MSIIVEDGTGKVDAESYATVTYANTYHFSRGNSDWAALTVSVKEQLLRKSTDYMLQKYRSLWSGLRVNDLTSNAQALDWPRDSVYIDGNALVSNSIVPAEVQKACCELALKANSASLLSDGGRITTKEVVDVLEVEYADNGAGSNVVKYSSVDNLLDPYLVNGVNGSGNIVGRVERA